MSATFYGVLAGIFSILSGFPYALRVAQGRVNPPLTSWALWAFIGTALLVTFWSSAGEKNPESMLSPICAAFFPVLIFTLLALRRSAWQRLSPLDMTCFLLGAISLGLWLYTNGDPELVTYALWLAILADGCASIPSFIHYIKHPEDDRPYAWVTFAIGYGFSCLAITDGDWRSYVLGIYMFVGGFCIAVPLVVYRVRNRIPLKEWI